MLRLWYRVNGMRSGVPRVFAWILSITALFSALASIGFAFGQRTQPMRRIIDALFLPAPANLAYAVFLGMLAAGINNRKRVAYRLLVAFLVVEALGDCFAVADRFTWQLLPTRWWDGGRRLSWLVPHLTIGNLAITALVLGVLVVSRGQFTARVQRASLSYAVATFTVLTGVFSLAGWGLAEAFPGSLRTSTDRLVWTIERILGGAFTFDVTRHGRAPGWLNLLLGFLGAVALLAASWVLLRSQRAAAVVDPGEERQLRQLLAEHGDRDSLGYFATRRDKMVIFTPDGRAAVTYRVIGGVTLASGDPIGDPGAWDRAIAAWLAEAREYAWTPAVMGAGEAGATAFARAGLRVIEFGDEAILHADEFALDGPDMRQVRQAVHRVRRAGYTVRIRRHEEISPEEMARIADLAAHWRDTETERGFSMALGRLGDPEDGRCVLVEALDATGKVTALLSFTPWGDTGVSLDLMRRDRTSDNGLIETMVAELMQRGPEIGIRRVSLNFAMFRSVFEDGARIGAGPVLRAWRRMLLFMSRWYQLESLYRSNVKYRPEWVPRYLCFEDVRDLAKVGLASAIAEGFLVVPSLPTLLRRGGQSTGGACPAGHPGGSPRAVGTGDARVPGGDATAAGAGTRPDATGTAGTRPDAAGAAGDGDPELAAGQAAHQVRDQTAVRLAKIAALRAAGADPYPPAVTRSHDCAAVSAAHAGLAPGAASGERVTVAGRVVLRRDHGGVCFVTLRDWSGDLQIMLTVDRLGAEGLCDWRALVDLGDHVGVAGEVVASRRGTVSVLAESWTLAAKCLRPLPDKHRGLTDPEALVRRRHLDLIVNPAARQMLRVRSAAVHAVRGALLGRGFVEVETPILQRVHGGATARPFVTRSNAYDIPLYLRIAPELYLKRLVTGGVEQVFELGRDFRNEGVDATHNPEFTMLEAYQAYADYHTMRCLVQDLVLAAAVAAHGAPVAHRQGADGATRVVDLSGQWPVVCVYDAVSTAVGEKIDPGTGVERLRELALAAGVPVEPRAGHGDVVLRLYERLVEATTQEPTFYVDFPVEVSPLTRGHRLDGRLAERWDLVAFGVELGCAYTELVDPVEQRRRLTEQSLRAAGGDPEAMALDEDFLQALEYAMPPTGGLGLGIDRLIMLLTGATIRETMPFPLVKAVDGE